MEWLAAARYAHAVWRAWRLQGQRHRGPGRSLEDGEHHGSPSGGWSSCAEAPCAAADCQLCQTEGFQLLTCTSIFAFEASAVRGQSDHLHQSLDTFTYFRAQPRRLPCQHCSAPLRLAVRTQQSDAAAESLVKEEQQREVCFDFSPLDKNSARCDLCNQSDAQEQLQRRLLFNSSLIGKKRNQTVY